MGCGRTQLAQSSVAAKLIRPLDSENNLLALDAGEQPRSPCVMSSYTTAKVGQCNILNQPAEKKIILLLIRQIFIVFVLKFLVVLKVSNYSVTKN